MSRARKDDYKVGYGRPPRDTQFKKGRSGNPKGRPRHRRNFRTVLDETLQGTIPATLNGRPCRMTRIDALVRTTVDGALKGDAKAVTNLMVMMRQAGSMGESTEPGGETDISAEDRAIVEGFFRRNGQPIPLDSKPAPASSKHKRKGG